MLVCTPGQGHVAVVASKIAAGIEEIVAVSRDLIALKATRANLRRNDYEGPLRCVHSADMCGACGDWRPEIALARLNEKEGTEVNIEKLRRLFSVRVGCRAIVGCKSAFASRLLGGLRGHGIRAASRKKRKGFCAMVLE